jgi:hypothetical protein
MIEFFLGFIAIVFVFAGVALIKSTRGTKPSASQSVNMQEAVGLANAASSKINYLSRLYNPVQFDQYLENIQGWMKDKVSKIKEASKYLMQRERQIATELYRKNVENAQKYLSPIKKLREKLETPLKELGVLGEINQLENAGYIDKSQLKQAGSEAIDLYNSEQGISSRKERLYGFLAKAKTGLLRKK